MSSTDDLHYIAHRAAQERRAAARAICPEVRRVHLDLASRYAERLASLERRTNATVIPFRPASA